MASVIKDVNFYFDAASDSLLFYETFSTEFSSIPSVMVSLVRSVHRLIPTHKCALARIHSLYTLLDTWTHDINIGYESVQFSVGSDKLLMIQVFWDMNPCRWEIVTDVYKFCIKCIPCTGTEALYRPYGP